MLKSVYGELKFWNPYKLEVESFFPNKEGISFFAKDISPLINEVTKFRIYNNKMLLLKKKGKNDYSSGLPFPILYKLFNIEKNTYNSKVINELIENGFHFLIHQFYTPEAGNCFLSFSLNVKQKIIKWANENNVVYEELSNIDKLKSS